VGWDALYLIEGISPSGKTAFLLEKFQEVIKNTSPSKILVFCHPNLRDDFLNMVKETHGDFCEIFVDNFTGFSKKILRENFLKAGLSADFKIISGKEEKIIVKNVLELIKNSLGKYKICIKHRGFVREVVDFIDRTKIKQTRIKNKHLLMIFNEYNKILKNLNAIDLRDLEILTLEILKKRDLKFDFEYLFLDGWETLNPVEVEILKKILKISNLKEVFIAGCEENGIFDFLGADASHARKTIENFKNAKKIKLKPQKQEKNYQVFRFLNFFDEASFIVDKIKQLLDEGVCFDEIAIITRDIGTEVKMIEEISKMKGIPVITSGGEPFFKNLEFLSFFSFLNWIVQKGIDEEDARKHFLSALDIPVFKLNEVEKSILRSEIIFKKISPQVSKKIEKVFNEANSLISDKSKSLPEKIFSLYKLTGLCEKVSEDIILSRLFSSFFNYVEKFSEIFSSSKLKGAIGLRNDVEEFVVHLNEEIDTFARENYLDEIKDAVKIYTVHQSYGKHFKFIFIPGFRGGNFPRDFVPNSYISSDIDEEKHYEIEEKIFKNAIAKGTEKVFITFVDAIKESDVLSPYLNQILESDEIIRWGDAVYPDTRDRDFEEMNEPELKLNFKVETLSPSKIRAYNECPFKFMVFNVFKIKTAETPELIFGNIIHSTLKMFHRIYRTLPYSSPDKAGEILKRIFEKYCERSKDKFHDKLTFETYKNFFGRFLDRYPVEDLPFITRKIIKREYDVECNLFKLPIKGRIDRMDKVCEIDTETEEKNSYIEIIDYKTTKNPEGKAKKLETLIKNLTEVGLPIYMLSCPEAQKISILYICSEKEPSDYPRCLSAWNGEVDWEDFKEKVEKVIDGIISGQFPRSFKNCRNCIIKNICNMWSEEKNE